MGVLIVGANGFIGRSLVKRMLKNGFAPVCVYHKSKEFIPKECKTIQIGKLLKENVFYDEIYLLSAYIPYGNMNKLDKRIISTNIELPLMISKKFPKSKIIFSSSVSVYGKNTKVIYEDSPFNTPGIYGQSKIAAETILRLHDRYQIVRFSSVYGKGMASKTFIPKIIKHAYEFNKIKIYDDGSRLQNYIFVEEAVDYLIEASKQIKSGIYLGIGERSYSNSEVSGIVANHFNNCKIEYLRKKNNPSFVYNNDKTKEKLKIKTIPLQKGIERMIYD